MKHLIPLLALLFLVGCELDGGGSSGSDKQDPDYELFEIVQVADVNDAYLSVLAFDPSIGGNAYFLFDISQARVTYEHMSCSNHDYPADDGIAPGKYVDVLADFNHIDEDLGAVQADRIFVHNNACLELGGVIVVQPEREEPR